MTEVFVICNQLGHFWGKSKTWVDGSDARVVVRIKHRDEASNTLFELSSKDVELRGNILAAELNAKGNPMVEVSEIPLPELPQTQEADELLEVPATDDSPTSPSADTHSSE